MTDTELIERTQVFLDDVYGLPELKLNPRNLSLIFNKWTHEQAVAGGKASAAKRRHHTFQQAFENRISQHFESMGGQKVFHMSLVSKYHTQEEAYKLAAKMKQSFENSLNHGHGVDKALHAKSVYPTSVEDFNKALKSKGTSVIIAPLKGAERAAEKVQNKYNGDWGKLTDLNRATVAVEHSKDLIPAMQATIAHMHKKGWKLASHENRTSNHLSGYRDLMLNFKKNGHVVEVQINTKAMLRAKEIGPGHKFYEHSRSVYAKAHAEGRELTHEEQHHVRRLQIKQTRLYHRAWRASSNYSQSVP